MQGKKFISPGAWFSMNYPSDWNEFEDGEGSFLFYNPDVWSGNFRISAFKGKAGYGKDAIRQWRRYRGSVHHCMRRPILTDATGQRVLFILHCL